MRVCVCVCIWHVCECLSSMLASVNGASSAPSGKTSALRHVQSDFNTFGVWGLGFVVVVFFFFSGLWGLIRAYGLQIRRNVPKRTGPALPTCQSSCKLLQHALNIPDPHHNPKP